MTADISTLERILDPLSRSFNEDTARALVELKADDRLAEELDLLAAKQSADTITEEERRKYDTFVLAGSFISVLQAKARLYLRQHAGA